MSFSSIPVGNNLRMVVYGRSTASGALDFPIVTFNGDTGANYIQQDLRAQSVTVTGQLTTGTTGLGLSFPASGILTGFPGSAIIEVPQYSNTTLQKIVSTENNYAQSGVPNLAVHIFAGQWLNTAAVSTIGVTLGANNFVAGSSAQLYCY
jgi:hypothetical protein